MNKFSQLGLSQVIVDNLEKLGFENPTPVQEKAIPLLLNQNPTDFIGLAQTGTGKTAAFGLPLIDLIEDNNSTQALVMAPTRELGQQIAVQLESFSKGIKSVNIEVVYGGAAITNQMKALKSPTQIIVATPGRLKDLINRRAVKLEKVQYVVLDEADEMLNMGFKEDIDEILSYTNEDRVTWLFSATMPNEVRKIVSKYMNNPLEVAVNTVQQSNKDITHQFVITKNNNKLAAIKRFLDLQPEMRAVMFCRTKWQTQEIADELGQLGYGVEALHGDLSQSQRDAVMKRFKTRSMQMLVATDVAARGIDVNDLTHVFNHTLPDQLESYTHRSGRTGRAGKKGVSMVFINPREGNKIKELEKKLNVSFERVEVPTLDELKSKRIHNWANIIVNTNVDQQSGDILNEVAHLFGNLSKEDLLKRLITTQLDHLTSGGGEEDNLNEAYGGSPDKRDRGKFNRYFINVGSIDGLTKADLVHYMADISGIERRYFGDITMQKNRSYVDIDSGKDRGISLKFEGIEIDGRAIRVNKDDQGPSGGFGGGSDKGGFKKKKRKDRPRPDKRRDGGRRSGRGRR
ncbi:DEAD/DEAH box helicase [Marinoscillum pacificum]|uniref:DEAD/DEAH box helicase n=1 Tax=Marinoscillum pacificum TaxID=392723 RepID=UPI0021571915|nr:DEAD/DEAH box helicase [Marinoscillum pacificum]